MLTWNEIFGLFAIAGQDVRIVAELEDAEIDLDLARIRRDRRGRRPGAVERVHRAVVEGRENVAVDDEDRLAGRSIRVSPPAVPSGVTLAAVRQPRAELPAVAAERLDQLGQIAGDDRDVVEPEPARAGARPPR